jgi:hypothetical protein
MPIRQSVHFLICSCGRHGCFVSQKRGRSQELYVRDDVDHHLLLFLLTEEINYDEIHRIVKEMERVSFRIHLSHVYYRRCSFKKNAFFILNISLPLNPGC